MAHDREVFKNSSWGRTRQPKNLVGTNGTALTEATKPTTVAPNAATDGHLTENQRYLHVTFYNSQAVNRTLSVWLYSHASGIWAQFKTTAGAAKSITVNNTTVSEVFEIFGADRVYVQANDTLDDNDLVYLAGSTF